MSQLPPEKSADLSWIKAIFTVLSAFVGIRRGQDHAEVAKQLRPVHYIVSGIFLMMCLILILITVVRVVIGMAASH